MRDKKWEYKVERVKPAIFGTTDKQNAQIEERLNRLGLEGWELVNVVLYGQQRHLYLKR